MEKLALVSCNCNESLDRADSLVRKRFSVLASQCTIFFISIHYSCTFNVIYLISYTAILVFINKQNFCFIVAPSVLWKFFIKKENTAVCNICKSEVKTSGNTSNLKAHMKRYHPKVQIGNSGNEISVDVNPLKRKRLVRELNFYRNYVV